jgi:signal transduction histidine kinase
MNPTSEERVIRTIGLLFGVGGAIFALLTLPMILDQLTVTPAAWTVAALIGTVALPILLGAAAPFAGVRTIRMLGAAAAAGNLLTLATVPAVMGPGASAAESPWPLQLTALGTTAAALTLPTRAAALDVVLTGALVSVDRWWTAAAPLGLVPLQDGLYAAFFCAIFAGLAIGATRNARAVDRAAAEAIAAVRSARDERVRADERARVNGLVHDHVLTTLLVASRSPLPDGSAAADAADALQRLRRVALAEEGDDAVSPDEMLDRLRAQLTAVAPHAGFGVEGERRADIPPMVADALVGATGEALRNTRRHAGEDAGVEVHVTLEQRCVEIAVVDDGVGFVRNEVPTNRLGIAASIDSRMRGVGGFAAVRSAVGRGTAVRVWWEDR